MKYTKFFKTLLLLVILSSYSVFSQDYYDPAIDPKWQKYYRINPSGIETNCNGKILNQIIDYVKFIPQRERIRGDVTSLKKVLLMSDDRLFEQLRIAGEYKAITYKHDDYFDLYNLYYQPIEKNIYDKYAPFLIALMIVDGVVSQR